MRDRTKLNLLVALGLLAAASRAHGQAKDPAVQALGDKIYVSVVALRNDEGHGTGMVLDDKGLILTNAHVVCSPLPFVVQAFGAGREERGEMTFKKVSLLGVHPEYDLALLQIDPTEHKAALKPVTIAAKAPANGDRVYTMGFPADVGAGLKKILTGGTVRNTDFNSQGDPYYELDLSVYFGNSGGPLVNDQGEVVGVISMMGKDSTSYAVPFSEVRTHRFVPLKQRAPNRSISGSFINEAEKQIDGFVRGHGGSLGLGVMFYEQALVYDSGNGALHAKVGEFNYHMKRYPFAVAYYLRSLQLQPWPDQGAAIYRRLGISLAALKNRDEAMAAWMEGLRKYPLDNARLWDDFAVMCWELGRAFEAACASRCALKTFTDNGDLMNEIYRKARDRMDPAELGKLREFENGLGDLLEHRKKEAEDARKDGKEFLTPEAEKLVRSFSGVQQEQLGVNFGKLGPQAEFKGLNVSDAELATLFIQGRVIAAKEHLSAGRFDQAVEILEDVIASYPKHPETESARLYLKLIRKKK